MKDKLALISAFCFCLMIASCVSFGRKPSPEPIVDAKSLQDFAGIYEDKSTNGDCNLSSRFSMGYYYRPGEEIPTRIEIRVGKDGLDATSFYGDKVGRTGHLRVKSISHGRIDLGIRSENRETQFFLTNYKEKTDDHETLAITKSRNLILVFEFSTVEKNLGIPSYKTTNEFFIFKRIQ